MTIHELCKRIDADYHEVFPRSSCSVYLATNLYPSISVACKLAGERQENHGGYWENDMFGISFSIDNRGRELPNGVTGESECPDVLQLNVWRKRYTLKPDHPHMCYSHKLLPFRQTTGDAERIIATLKRYFIKLHALLEEDLKAGNVHKDHEPLLRSKL
jgi:hypothetical protein